MEIWLGNNLDKRDASPIEIDPRDRPSKLRPLMDEFPRILPPRGLSVYEPASLSPEGRTLIPPRHPDGEIVLGNLVPFGEVGIEVVLSVENHFWQDLALQCQGSFYRKL